MGSNDSSNDSSNASDQSGRPAATSLPVVEVVAHCWNYFRLLTYHLSAFVLAPPKRCHLISTIFYSTEDDDTAHVLLAFSKIKADLQTPNVIWNFRPIQTSRLLRRAIGRNIAAKESMADIVIFTDCDYLYRDRALDEIVDSMLGGAGAERKLGYVRQHAASTDHAAGDAEIQAIQDREPGVVDIDPFRYSPSRLSRPIGGSQIVTGEFARTHGYLPFSRRFQRPSAKWERTFEDRSFRGYCLDVGLTDFPIDCPTVYRIRHSKRGRFDRGVKL